MYNVIKRYVFDYESKTLSNVKQEFISEGVWEDGHLAYSKLDDIANDNFEELCMYVQIRYKNTLVMMRV